jgi:hypothetical protein
LLTISIFLNRGAIPSFIGIDYPLKDRTAERFHQFSLLTIAGFLNRGAIPSIIGIDYPLKNRTAERFHQFQSAHNSRFFGPIAFY